MANKDPKTELKIRIKDPLTFEATHQVAFMSPNDLCKKVNGMFSKTFQDYAGCAVSINTQQANANSVPYTSLDGPCPDVPANAFYMSLHFKDRGEAAEGLYKTLTPIVANINNTNNNTGYSNMFSNFIKARANQRVYNVNDETKEMLMDMMFKNQFEPNNAKNLNQYWARHIVEYQDNNNAMSKPSITSCIRGLDLNKVVTKLYSIYDDDREMYVDENGDPVEYRVSPYIPPVFSGVQKDVIFQVIKLDVNTLRNFVDGMYSGTIMNNIYVRV